MTLEVSVATEEAPSLVTLTLTLTLTLLVTSSGHGPCHTLVLSMSLHWPNFLLPSDQAHDGPSPGKESRTASMKYPGRTSKPRMTAANYPITIVNNDYRSCLAPESLSILLQPFQCPKSDWGIFPVAAGVQPSHVLATLALVSSRPCQKALKRVPYQDMGFHSRGVIMNLLIIHRGHTWSSHGDVQAQSGANHSPSASPNVPTNSQTDHWFVMCNILFDPSRASSFFPRVWSESIPVLVQGPG